MRGMFVPVLLSDAIWNPAAEYVPARVNDVVVPPVVALTIVF